MKMLTVFVFLFGIFSHSFCQTTIASYSIFVCCKKTTNLVFAYPVRSVDRGSEDLLAQKARGAENVLQLKAAREEFETTNLSVITGDGKLFSFIVGYSRDPKVLNISFAVDSAQSVNPGDSAALVKYPAADHILLTAEKLNEAILDHDGAMILEQKHFLHKHLFAEGMQLTLQGIYLKDDALWFLFRAFNASYLDYHPEFLRFFIRDKTKAARTAIQESEIPPVYPLSALKIIPGKKTTAFLLAFAPFTFSRNRKLIIEMSEAGGGRAIAFPVSHRLLLKARPVSR